MSIAFIYPGQGSQKVGMLLDLLETYPLVKERFDRANTIVGYDLWSIVSKGPVEELTKTEYTQPALFTVESILTDILKEQGIIPTVTMGHSLGEYSALYSAGVLSFEDGLKLVSQRGTLMAEAGKSSKGGMAAIIGMTKESIVEVLANITTGTVVTANENSPEQTVISGDEEAVNWDLTNKQGAGVSVGVYRIASRAPKSRRLAKWSSDNVV